MGQKTELQELVDKMPENGWYVNQQMIWCGDVGQYIDYAEKVGGPLDYVTAFKKMLLKIKTQH